MKGRFEGWYFKHQANGHTLALIPGRAEDHAFVQIVTDNEAHYVRYPLSAYQKGEDVRVGDSVFSTSGLRLDIRQAEISLAGEISYNNLTPIRSDIMGPFRFFPMECRHSVLSMDHKLEGTVSLDGTALDFTGGRGYIESDSGRSFPSGYTWVQCNDFGEDISIMAAVARIPFYGLRFWGCICVVWLRGREYRLATYRGVRIVQSKPGVLELRQGKHRLLITIRMRNAHPLPSPRFGRMDGTIRESLSCPARFRFTEGDHILFEGESAQASYEYEIS